MSRVNVVEFVIIPVWIVIRSLHIFGKTLLFAIIVSSARLDKRRVIKGRDTSESLDLESMDLWSNHVQTTPTFPNDHAQFL